MSFASFISAISKFLPSVEAPKAKPGLSGRLKYSFFVLVIFFILGNIALVGLTPAAVSGLGIYQIILASNIGTLLTVGIGPIVVASIILQLLVGTKIWKLDFGNPEERALFSSTQKILAIILSFFEALVYVQIGFLTPQAGMFFWVVLQVALGSIVLLYLDEVVQKYGIGSGISLFIAGGVAAAVIWRVFNPVSTIGLGLKIVSGGAAFDFATGAGLLWRFFAELGNSLYTALVQHIFPILFALIIFFIVIYFEGVYVNIPITMGRSSQFGRYPVKFFYVSNLPVILSAALFANIALIYAIVEKKAIPFLTTGLFYLSKYTTAPYDLTENLFLQGFAGLGGQILQAVIYLILLSIVCVFFGVMWVKMAGQDSEAVSNQLQRSGMFLPGFRRDPRVIKSVLDRYIPTITIIGSIFVAVLAGFASITNAVGTGMGILLTVDIVYRLYEEIVKEQVSTDSGLLTKLVSGMKH
ncbi:MAG: preprotein translocase subunit SecY [Candidatus Diapherotrites archaeon CG08_land_8_20_14_0_20_30_16]|nr:MAG: preprotein translocase subunit SecY [Candidatus Diapherotrites archaeon CG08_land_8_20_14_0_20_30_16]